MTGVCSWESREIPNLADGVQILTPLLRFRSDPRECGGGTAVFETASPGSTPGWGMVRSAEGCGARVAWSVVVASCEHTTTWSATGTGGSGQRSQQGPYPSAYTA